MRKCTNSSFTFFLKEVSVKQTLCSKVTPSNIASSLNEVDKM
ncbi:hypothetical protein HMPREF1979_00010 [Actinomyces johnsonii F0542]|uniref:Uncharacterized protein n=1 Tax=Actinomyces johnsonii F0542 TaxID=1321818 RepID=U1QE25_9ACTO|nr:hypothetical protein HMPREF1979_00010 [Actinomyces johnsonii F0542]